MHNETTPYDDSKSTNFDTARTGTAEGIPAPLCKYHPPGDSEQIARFPLSCKAVQGV
jgi:hypothetical protein